MILSDRSIREEIAAGRIEVEPFDPSMVQPSSIDVRLDRYFRVFLNHTTAVIDVKQNLEELTQLVEIPPAEDDAAFILHPGEFVLGATLERVRLPDDMVARIEGKSSLGRLGLLIHSSLPGSEEVLFLDADGLRWRRIEEIVGKRLEGSVVSFDPATLAVGYHAITGWYEGPADRIYQVRLASGRSVEVTGGHNLFTLDGHGRIAKVRTGQLTPGTRVAIAGRIPDPTPPPSPSIAVGPLVPQGDGRRFTCSGPTVDGLIAGDPEGIRDALARVGVSAEHHVRAGRVPIDIVQEYGALEQLTADDRVVARGGRDGIPAQITVDRELAWLLGFYVAEGHLRRNQAVFAAADQVVLDRVERGLHTLGVRTSRGPGAVAACSSPFVALLGWLGGAGTAGQRRLPSVAFGWPASLVDAFVSGMVDGGGCRQTSCETSGETSRTSICTSSEGLARDLLLLCSRLGVQARATCRGGGRSVRWQVELQVPAGEREIPLAVPRRRPRDGDLCWDEVLEVVDTGRVEAIYDLEVRPGGRKVENFLAGRGGVLVSNTAGFIDPGFDGHITLELSNVANLPITLYPGMKVGQISFHRMTTAADEPYGSSKLGSKYQGQRGPTPSRYWENFNPRE